MSDNSMIMTYSDVDDETLQWLKQTYFSDPDCYITLDVGDVLLREGEENYKLFLVLEGELIGSMDRPDEASYELFVAKKDHFVGLLSFFSRKYRSNSTVIATQHSKVAYIENTHEFISHGSTRGLYEQFAPVVIANLACRRKQEMVMAWEKEQAVRNLLESEKRASLGQMAAGIAHELNNAIAVLDRNAGWLSEELSNIVLDQESMSQQAFALGLEGGRSIRSSEARKRGKLIASKFGVSRNKAMRIAETSVDDAMVAKLIRMPEDQCLRVLKYWDIGATLNSSKLAARHAAHVVKSVKVLGVEQSERVPDLDLNESIEEALTLLSSKLRMVEIKVELTPLSPMTFNLGEMMQIWINIIKNACEALESANTEAPVIEVRSWESDGFLNVGIKDNGLGIPKEVKKSIFQPNFSTKAEGLAFGLGLGLTISERIIAEYNGSISVRSQPGETEFTVIFPKCGGKN